MIESNKFTFELLKLFLPKELFDYFAIVNLEVNDNEIHVYLDEENNPPKEFEGDKLTSKGFHKAIKVQDFPLRDKAVFLFIRRRRWLVESGNKTVIRDWDSVAKGTHYTKAFAFFCKT